MIDPATGWFEIIELPCDTVLKKTKEGTMTEEVIFDKSSHQVARLFNKQWLSRYPRATNVTYDNGSEFKLNFEALCDSCGLKHKPTTIKNPQANAILEHIHQVLGEMMRTSGIDMSETVTPAMIDGYVVDAAWAVHSIYHIVLKCTPGQAIFRRDMLFDIPFIADWSEIGQRRQDFIDKT